MYTNDIRYRISYLVDMLHMIEKMQNAKCETQNAISNMQNEKCRIENAKCKIQGDFQLPPFPSSCMAKYIYSASHEEEGGGS